ncbi:hypothetical protein AB0K80_00120 [Streptomyces sp. NPDC052682]|uniref:hypothetical protein n=1 Tax=Streptomyces sp. NPDC052682 TaxID=3154954 RepID=UPI00343179F6
MQTRTLKEAVRRGAMHPVLRMTAAALLQALAAHLAQGGTDAGPSCTGRCTGTKTR